MNRKIKWVTLAVSVLLLLSMVLASCGTTTVTSTTTLPPSTSTTTTTSTTTSVSTTTSTTVSTTTSTTAIPEASSLTGAGSTFALPLYTKWFGVYNQLFSVQINYQGVGSGAGITQITNGTVDFGASDGIMTDAQIAAAQAAYGPILHIPMADGSVTVAYNLPGITQQINLTGAVLANIYLETIKTWNDPAITALNPGITLPSTPIVVVHRSDSSGTTYIFTNYLCKVSSQFNTQIGNATSVNWPVDEIGGSKNAGVAAAVQQTPGSIGYIELAYALQNNITFASLQNAAGVFISPSLAATTAAATGITLPDDMKIMLTNSTNPAAYPIVGFTWILVYQHQTNQAIGEALVKILWWGIHDGQQYCSEPTLDYGSLSADAVTKAENEILSITYNGQPLLTR